MNLYSKARFKDLLFNLLFFLPKFLFQMNSIS